MFLSHFIRTRYGMWELPSSQPGGMRPVRFMTIPGMTAFVPSRLKVQPGWRLWTNRESRGLSIGIFGWRMVSP